VKIRAAAAKLPRAFCRSRPRTRVRRNRQRGCNSTHLICCLKRELGLSGFGHKVSYRTRPGRVLRGEEGKCRYRGRGRHHNCQLAGLRRYGDAGNGRVGGLVQRYYENGAMAGKGWGKCGRGVGVGGTELRGLEGWVILERVGQV